MSTTTTVHPVQVSEKLEAGEPARVLDVRTPVEYETERIAQAELMPLDQLDAEALRDGDGGPIYLLCTTGKRAGQAYHKLAEAGLSNVAVMEGGLSGWKQAGLPVLQNKAVMSLERQVRIGAGSLVLLGVLLGWLVHPGFYGLAAFVGAGLLFAGLTDFCGMALVLMKMPWNRRPRAAA